MLLAAAAAAVFGLCDCAAHAEKEEEEV